MNDNAQFGLFSNNGADRGLADSATRDTAEIPLRAEMPAAPTQLVLEGKQVALFDKGEWWENHWKGMPEFVSDNIEPYQTVYVHFENRADLEEFAKLVKQRITLETKSLWYPEAEVNDFSKKKYMDTYEPGQNEDDES